MAGRDDFAKTSGMRLWLAACGVSLVALVVYALTLAGYVFPGESTHLFTQWMGWDALEAPKNPIWGGVVKFVGGLSFPASVAVRINLVSLVCGVLSAGLICGLVGFFVRSTVKQEDTIRFRDGASVVAGVVCGLTFVFSTVVWQASTHLEYRLFDICLALLLFTLFIPMLRWPRALSACAALLGVGVGLGLVENTIFAPLAPLFLLCLVVSSVKTGRKFYLPAGLFLVAAAVGYIVFARSVASAYLQLPEAAAGGFQEVGDVLVKNIQNATREMRQWVGRPGWMVIFVLAVMPFVACMFAAPRGLNNERTWSQYLFHAAMTICVILAFATPLAPESVLRAAGIPPVATSTLVAVTCGYLAAYWYLLARAPLPVVESGSAAPAPVVVLGRRAAPAVMGCFLGIVALAAFVNAFSCARDRGAFADVCANEIVDRLGDRTWLVTDGLLDDHLRAVAASRGKELNLVCLQRDMDDAYLKTLAALVKEKKLAAGHANLALSIQLGVLPFLQDWFMGDPKITSEVAIFGVPDFWYMAERQPTPECLFFGGVQNLKKDVDGAKALADFKAFWAKMEPVLHADKRKGSREIAKAEDPVDSLRLQLRRHVGFVANNLGVVLQDLGMDKEAFEVYELVLKVIDCDNICSLFNEFEMARAGVKEALAHKGEIERKLKAIVDDPKRRYMLWSLSRYYGYIRSPEIFARMGYAWARSGQTGNAIAQVQRAIDFVPADRQAGLLNMMAAIYASGNQ
ncbi:MAG: protein O-mannosyl-transferase family, partial [Kiritimatiellia bacterium]